MTRSSGISTPISSIDVGDGASEQGDLKFVGVAAQVEVLAEPDGAERVDAGTVRLAAPQQRQARAAAADLDAQRPGALQGGMAAQRVADREEDQAAFLGLVDDLEREAGAAADAIEKQLAVARFADRARRHGANALDAVASR